MDAADYHEIRERLRTYAEATYSDLAAAFPYERLIRICAGLAWSEVIDGDEIQFELVVLDHDENSVRVHVEAILGPIGGPSYIHGDEVRRTAEAS